MNASKLKRAVETSPLTKKEIARRSNISPQALAAILDGGADPKVSNLQAIAKVLDIKMSFLFDEETVKIDHVDKSFNSNADEIIKGLTAIIDKQADRIQQLTDKLIGL